MYAKQSTEDECMQIVDITVFEEQEEDEVFLSSKIRCTDNGKYTKRRTNVTPGKEIAKFIASMLQCTNV